jgi:hypothetical protein
MQTYSMPGAGEGEGLPRTMYVRFYFLFCCISIIYYLFSIISSSAVPETVSCLYLSLDLRCTA